MFDGFIDLIGAYFDGGMLRYVLVYVVAFAFLATVPILIRSVFRR